MKRVFKHFKGYGKKALTAPLFKLIEAAFDLTVPLVIASIIDNGILKDNSTHIYKMCAILALLALSGLAFSISAQYFSAKVAVGFATRLRHSIFNKVQNLSYTELDCVGTSTLITRITSDVNQIQNGVNLALRLLLRSPFIVFGAMIMAFTIDVKTALIFAITIPVLSVIVFGIMLKTMPIYKKVQSNLDDVTRTTRENLTGVRVIRAFCNEDKEIGEFKKKNTSLNTLQQLAGRISALMNPLTYIVINAAIIALIYTGAVRVNTGSLKQGEVIALYNYMAQILVELIKLASLIITITKAVVCARRVESVLTLKSSLETNQSSKALNDGSKVRFDNVSLKYKNAGENSLKNISFVAMPGQTVGIIGATASGKSSLINLIPHFYDASAGTVYFDGKDVKAIDTEELRDKIGIVPQKAVLFKGTIRENLLWGKSDATDEELKEALIAAQAYDFVCEKENGLDFEIEQNGRNLSGGQRQRLTIARALVKSPELLILDDSSSALDYQTDAALRKSLRKLKQQPTVFIVSQRTSSIMHAELIIVLDDGKICAKGTHEELLKSCDVYKEIYESQFKKEGE